MLNTSSHAVYYLIFAALMIGTYLTVQAAFIDLGAFNTVVALAIACIKGDAGGPVLHAREVQHPADLGGRRRQHLLAGDPARADFSDYLTRPWRTFG